MPTKKVNLNPDKVKAILEVIKLELGSTPYEELEIYIRNDIGMVTLYSTN